MKQNKQEKKYEAPKIELIEMVPTTVLCASIDTSGGLMDLTVTGGGWTSSGGN